MQLSGPTQGVDRFFQFSLLGMLGSGYCALLGSGALDAPSAALVAIALGLRLLALLGVIRLDIPQSWVTGAAVAYLVFFPLDYFFLTREFFPATVHLVVFVCVLLLLSARRPREFLLLKVAAFLEMLAASLLSGSPSFFIFLVLFLLSAVAAFSSWEIRKASSTGGKVARVNARISPRLSWLAGLTTIGILVITAGLFFVLPRTARAAMQRLMPFGARVSGFASEITLGRTGPLRQQATPVFHVRFEENKRPRHPLRWRGTALAEFDGMRWFNSPAPAKRVPTEEGLVKLVEDDQRRRAGERSVYQVVLHAGAGDHLFVSGIPEVLRLPSRLTTITPQGGLRVPFQSGDGMLYDVYAFYDVQGDTERLSPVGAPVLDGDDRNFYLRLPVVDARVIALARQITSGLKTDRERATAIAGYLRENYEYSLDPLEQEVDDPLTLFLFERKKGHCEYFASSMATLLRAVWIPSRVATGFLEGDYNPISGWHVVRASNAHSWVEAWMPGEGWVSLDPTPPNPNAQDQSAFSRLSMLVDAADTFWQEWVMGYDLDRQMTLAFEMDQSRRSFGGAWITQTGHRLEAAWEKTRTAAWRARDEWRVLLAGLAVAALIAIGLRRFVRRAVWRRVSKGAGQASDASRMYQLMLAALAKRGLVKSPELTPLEFVRRAPEGTLRDLLDQFTGAYQALRYGGHSPEAVRLASLLDKIERLPR